MRKNKLKKRSRNYTFVSVKKYRQSLIQIKSTVIRNTVLIFFVESSWEIKIANE